MSNSSLAIGRVVEVTNTSITVKVNDKNNFPYLVVNAKPYRIGGVGSFVKVSSDVYEVVNEKSKVDGDDNEQLQAMVSSRVMQCNIVGYFERHQYYQGSSGNIPNIFDNVETVSDDELSIIFSVNKSSRSIKIGRYVFKQNIEFYLDIEKFFASHTLIVGNTGSGKSNTINSIYSELFRGKDTSKSYFLFIDTNGEYSTSFTEDKIVRTLNTEQQSKNEVKIPISSLDSQDWKLLLEATEKTQYPIIKKVWQYIEKEIFDQRSNISLNTAVVKQFKRTLIGIVNSSITSSVRLNAIWEIFNELSFYNDGIYKEFSDLIESIFSKVSVNNSRLVIDNSYIDVSQNIVNDIENYKISSSMRSFDVDDFGLMLNNEHIYRVFKYNANEQNTSPLVTRFNSSKKDFKNVFKAYNPQEKNDFFSSIFDDSNIVVCDVVHAKKDIRRIMVTLLCSKLFNHYISRRFRKSSMHIIVDEAHNYLSDQKVDKEDAIAKTCIETFENIIKEGRKFGVFLTISTQRPSDITGTLLSQSQNYIIHKLVNPRDIEIVKSAVPFIDEMSMKMLSILAPGQAIFTGTAFNRPSIVQVDYNTDTTLVDSATIKLDEIWSKRTKAVSSKVK